MSRTGCHDPQATTQSVGPFVAALEAYVRRKKQLKVLDLFGKIHFAQGYDYKAARGAR